jgi:Ca2+-binding EF-hand superfamily protein
MEIIVILAIVVILGYLAYNKIEKAKNESQKDTIWTAPEVVKVQETVKEEVKAVVETLDVNKDGKVNLDDAKEVVKRGRKKKAS